ncbi:hypothetical protein MNBD_GAMMA06-69, partial [hydrothermal vent metagenome]
DNYPNNINYVQKLADECRNHKMDERLIIKPSINRGVGR